MTQKENSKSSKFSSFKPDLYSSQPVSTKPVEPNMWITAQEAGFLPYKQTYGLVPRDSIDIDPEFFYLREQKYKEYLDQNRDNDSVRMRKEVYPILFGPNSDVAERCGYRNMQAVNAMSGDPASVSAARMLVLMEATALGYQMDLLNTLGLVLAFSRMKGVPLNKVFMAEKSIAKISTMMAMTKGMPMNKEMYDAYLRESRFLAMKTEGASPDDARMVIAIPFVPYGVCDISGDNKTNPTFSTSTKYLDPAKYGSQVPQWADKLSFYPTRLGTKDSQNYGWVTSARNIYTASGVNGAADVHSDGIRNTPELCATPNEVERLVGMLWKHIEWLAVKLTRLWAGIPFADGSNQPLIDAAMRETSFANYKSDNDIDLRRLLIDGSMSMFNMTFDWNEFDAAIFEHWKSPVDYVKAMKHYNCIDSKVKATRQLHYDKWGFSTVARSTDTLVAQRFEAIPNKVKTINFNDKTRMLLSYYQTTAVEITNTYNRLVAASGGRQNMTDNEYTGQFDYSECIPRPDIAFTCVPNGFEGELDNIVAVGMYPVAFVGTDAQDQIAAYNAIEVNESVKECIPNFSAISANDGKADMIYAYNDANINPRTRSQITVDTKASTFGSYKKNGATRNAYVYWAVAKDFIDTSKHNASKQARLLPERVPAGHYTMQKILRSYNKNVIFDGHAARNVDDYTIGKDAMSTFVDGEMFTSFKLNDRVLTGDERKDYKYNGKTIELQWRSAKDPDIDLTQAAGSTTVYNDIKPWMVRQFFHDGSVNDDEIYALDYCLLSSESIANNSVDKVDYTASAYATNAKLAKVHLRQTSFLDGAVDGINVNIDSARILKMGYIKDNFNIFDVEHISADLMVRGIYAENIAMLSYDTRRDLATSKSDYKDNTLSKLEGFNSANDSSEILGVGPLTFRFDNLMAIQPWIDGEYCDDVEMISLDPEYEAYSSTATTPDINKMQNMHRLRWKYHVLRRLSSGFTRGYGSVQWQYNINFDGAAIDGTARRIETIDGSIKVLLPSATDSLGSVDMNGFYDDFTQIGRTKFTRKDSNSNSSKGASRDDGERTNKGKRNNGKTFSKSGNHSGGKKNFGKSSTPKRDSSKFRSSPSGSRAVDPKDSKAVSDIAEKTAKSDLKLKDDQDPLKAGIQKVTE